MDEVRKVLDAFDRNAFSNQTYPTERAAREIASALRALIGTLDGYATFGRPAARETVRAVFAEAEARCAR